MQRENIQKNLDIKKVLLDFLSDCDSVSPALKEKTIQELSEDDNISPQMVKFILHNIIMNEDVNTDLKYRVIEYLSNNIYLFKALWEDALLEQKKEFERQIQNKEKEYEGLKKKMLANYIDLKNKIESMLPNASAIGVAKTFADEMKKRQLTAFAHLMVFYWTIIVIAFTILSFYIDGGFLNKIVGIDEQFSLVNFLKILSFEAPLAFLATFSAKRSHQNKRIYEEYAHKYTVAMTYVGLCKEIREHEEIYGKEAVKNLNEGFRHAVFRNPSIAIDRKIEDLGTPFELVERLIRSVGQPAAEALIKDRENKGA